jgi:hypothetical protein
MPAWSTTGVGPMASMADDGDFGLCGDRPAPLADRLGGLARRLCGMLDAQRRSETDRAIARLLAQSGGRLTDSLEREILHKVFASDWTLPQ